MRIIRLLLLLSIIIVCLTHTVRAMPAPFPDDFEVKHYFQIVNVDDFDEYVFFQYVPYDATDNMFGDYFSNSAIFEIIIDKNFMYSIPETVDFVELYALKRSYVDFEELMLLNSPKYKNRINSYFYQNQDKWIKGNIDLVYPDDLGWSKDYNGITDLYMIENLSENKFDLVKQGVSKNYVERPEEDEIGGWIDEFNIQNYVWIAIIGLVVIVVFVIGGLRIIKSSKETRP